MQCLPATKGKVGVCWHTCKERVNHSGREGSGANISQLSPVGDQARTFDRDPLSGVWGRFCSKPFDLLEAVIGGLA
jgi:hypothetical protein